MKNDVLQLHRDIHAIIYLLKQKVYIYFVLLARHPNTLKQDY